jgi:competence protein ComEC
VPLIAQAVTAYVAGLLAGYTPSLAVGTIIAGAASALAALVVRPARTTLAALALLVAVGAWVARETPPPRARAAATEAGGPFGAWRASTAARLDTIFRGDSPLAKALLIADTHDLPSELRDRYAAAGIVHILSISGLHVAIIAEVMLVLMQALGLARRSARWSALALTALYVAAIGAPPPALRSAAMLGVVALTQEAQRPTSPWAALAIGAAVPLVDPTVVLDLGWQLSVAGFAALIGAGTLAKRIVPRRWRGWRRVVARDLCISVVATAVTAPLVAWTFGRVSLVAPLTNLAAGPIIACAQPALFLAMVLSPVAGAARFVADATHPLLAALDAVATAGAAVPGAALAVSPTLATAVLLGVSTVAALVACAARHWGRPALVGAFALVLAVAAPVAATGSGEMELHMIDVGQGDAIAIRTPHGQWILVDAGRAWHGGDAGRTTVVPYLRRYGGPLAMFVLSHPHADHVGGAATVLRTLRPAIFMDAAFAGTSPPYADALRAAADAGIPWQRVHPGDSTVIDGVSLITLAPDSIWTSTLTDPNLASTVLRVRYGAVTALLTGDAEAPEEEWLESFKSSALRADILKVAHHGSATGSTAAFVEAVQPRVALVSVGAKNGYGHPNAAVLARLRDHGATVWRTDELGTVVVRTDGRTIRLSAGGRTWSPSTP